jgi:hypothetical protein
VRDEVLLITTPEAAATMLETRVHRVADIVLPVESLTGFGQLGAGQNNDLFGVNPGGQNNFGQNQNQNQNQNGQNPFNNQNNNPFERNGQNQF